MLIPSLDPLRVYLHREGRVMQAAQPYRPAGHGVPDRNAYLATVERSDLTLSDYRERLIREGGDARALWPRIEWMLAATVAAARDDMMADRPGVREAGLHRFALLECEVIVDEQFKPWLLGCRPWPSSVTEAAGTRGAPPGGITASVLEDTLGLLGALEEDAPADVPRQAPAPSRDENAGADRRLVEAAAAELARAGGFSPLMPSADPAWLALLAERRPADVRLARLAASSASSSPVVRPRGTSHYFLDDSLVLHGEQARDLSILNPTASFIWLRCADGATLAEIATELAEVFPASRETVEQDVWTTAADWIARGLLTTGPARAAAPVVTPVRPPRRTSCSRRRRHAPDTGGSSWSTPGRPECRGPCGTPG